MAVRVIADSSPPVNLYHDVGHRDPHRRFGFVDGDVHRGDTFVRECRIGDSLCNPFYQVMALAGENAVHRFGEFAVVNGVGQFVGVAGRCKVEMKREVDDEPLALDGLVKVHAVERKGFEAADVNAVGDCQPAMSARPSGPIGRPMIS